MAFLKSWNFRLYAPVALLAVIAALIAGHATFVHAQPKTATPQMLLDAPLTFSSDGIQAFLQGKNSPLAAYSEDVGDGTTLPAAQLFWIASQGENYGISPRAVLTTFYLEYGLAWPQNGGLLAHLQAIAARLAGLEAEGSSRLVTGLPGQPAAVEAKALPAETNTAQYALEQYYAPGAKTISGRDATPETWVQAYTDLFGADPSPKVVDPPPTARPFLRLPFNQPKDNFIRVESFFDHYTPGNFGEPTIYRLDGKFLPNGLFKTCWDGLTCYSGHNAIDYSMPTGTPLYAAAAGKVILRYDFEGGLILDHGNGYRTVYWHMDRILVNLSQVLGDGQLLGYSGNRGQSTGPHLHFGLRLSALSRDVDPYGWWAAQKDPWPYPSRFMFRGGLLVDDGSDASQLFYGQFWTRDPAGYNGQSWYTLSGTTFGSNTNWGIWGTSIPRAGDYRVYAFWPKTPQNTTSASYQVWHKGGSTTITLSQRDDGDRWVLLGTFPFDPGQAAVLLTDLTQDNPPKQRVYFDAVKWEPVVSLNFFPDITGK